jgi:hypothetical protein
MLANSHIIICAKSALSALSARKIVMHRAQCTAKPTANSQQPIAVFSQLPLSAFHYLCPIFYKSIKN